MEQPKAIVSHVPDIRHRPVQMPSPRAISFVVLNIIRPIAPAVSPPPTNSVPRSITGPAFEANSTSLSVVLPAA